MNSKKTVCAFLGSRHGFTDDNQIISSIMGNLLDKDKFKLLYGGGNNGLMGVISRAFFYSGGEVESVTTQYFADSGSDVIPQNQLIKPDLMSRLRALIKHGDFFIVLPGGIGTLTELTMVLQLNKLEEMDKPIYIINYKGYYNKLLDFITHQKQNGYLKGKDKFNMHVYSDVLELVNHLNNTY